MPHAKAAKSGPPQKPASDDAALADAGRAARRRAICIHELSELDIHNVIATEVIVLSNPDTNIIIDVWLSTLARLHVPLV